MPRTIFARFKLNRSFWVGLASLVMLFAVVSVAQAAQAPREFSLRYDVLANGANIQQIGNTLMTCVETSGNALTYCNEAKAASNNSSTRVNDYLNMQFVDLDSDNTTTSSSSATLLASALPTNMTVLRAQLYWGGSITPSPNNSDNPAAINTMKFRKDNGSYQTITADQLDWIDNGTAGTNQERAYGATADITSLFTANGWKDGTYWGADVYATTGCTLDNSNIHPNCNPDGSMGNFAGWSLLLVYQDTDSTTLRYVGIDDGFQCVTDSNSPTCSGGDSPKTITFSGLNIPGSPSDQRWGMSVWDGDNGIDGDSFSLQGNTQSQGLRDSDNYFRGLIGKDGVNNTDRSPSDVNTLGTDLVETSGSSISGSDITGSFETSGDFYVVHYFWITSTANPPSNDYGDAPSSYGNAWHDINNSSPTALRMGTAVTDAETGSRNGSPNTTNALGDDLTGTDDEDGIATFPAFTSDTTNYCVDVKVTNNFGSSANLSGWLDFNHNGTFGSSEDDSITGIATGTTNATQQLCWGTFTAVPAGTNLYLRLRLTTSSMSGSSDIGAMPNGEVEDYRIVVTNPTAAHLGTFHAKPSRKQVKLMWNTGSELDVSGFNLYRSTRKDGDYVKVNDELIPAQNIGSATGSDYIYKNKKLKPNKVYWYKLEVVGRNGTLEMSDPLKVKTKPPKS